jgi:hypothetical protein
MTAEGLEPWFGKEMTGAEERLRDLQRRFRVVSRRFDRRSKLRGLYRQLKIFALVAIATFAIAWALANSPWPLVDTLKHLAAFPNCSAARAVGLAPASKGAPGYWAHHDADDDGMACEPWPPDRIGNR